MNYTLEDHFKYFASELSLSKKEITHWKSLFRAFPQINWRDAIGPSQLKSKKLLLDHLKNIVNEETKIISIGGWIGLTEYLIRLYNIPRKSHLNLDIDAEALAISYRINHQSLHYVGLPINALDFNYQISELVVINTSCEHINNFSEWLNLLPKGTKCILQSNNMFGVEGHVNCSQSLEDFKASAPLSHFFDLSALDIGNNWQRYTIAGVV